MGNKKQPLTTMTIPHTHCVLTWSVCCRKSVITATTIMGDDRAKGYAIDMSPDRYAPAKDAKYTAWKKPVITRSNHKSGGKSERLILLIMRKGKKNTNPTVLVTRKKAADGF